MVDFTKETALRANRTVAKLIGSEIFEFILSLNYQKFIYGYLQKASSSTRYQLKNRETK